MDISKDKKFFYTISETVEADSGEKYEIQDFLGAGGNGVVYEVIDCSGNEFAIKFNLNFTDVSKARFKQEVRVLRSIKHPHLLSCIDEGTVQGKAKNGHIEEIPFMIMEKADSDLRKYLWTKGKISYSEYISQFCGLSEALAELNQRVVHRDIKLENILIIGDRWVLSDLGLCSYLSEDEHEDLTGVHEKIGPKYWMSPEAINRMYDIKQEIIPASDVFQLSAVFWFVVNGKYPLGIVCEDDWNNSDLLTCRLLIKCLSFNANSRPENGEKLYGEFSLIREYYETH